jgi:ribosome-associated protein
MKKSNVSDTHLDILQDEVEMETFKCSGPGGQRKNKKETAVRLKHLPSGITVIATEHRSQAKNRELAFQRLREKLAQLRCVRKRRVPTQPPPGTIQEMKWEKSRLSEKKRLRRKPEMSESW